MMVGRLIAVLCFLAFAGDTLIPGDLWETASCCLNNLCLDLLLEVKSQRPVGSMENGESVIEPDSFRFIRFPDFYHCTAFDK